MKMVHREEHNENFTLVDNSVLKNVNLSWETRGFFVYLLSLPDNWEFSIRGLVKQTGTSESVIRRLLTELKEEGYISLKKHTDKNGRIVKWTWDIYESGTETLHLRKSPQVVKTTSGENHKWCEPHEVKPLNGSTTCGESDTIQSTNNNKVLNIQSTNTNKVLNEGGAVSEIEEMFEQFWSIYPKKVDKKGSLRAFKNIKKLKTVFPEILQAVEVQKKSVQWQKDNGQYIPNPTTYIHQERWNTVTEADTIQNAQDQMLANNLGNFSFWRNEENAQ